MHGRKGFTLLEMLVVVVIAGSVLLFAVPAYKRMQDKNAFTSAQGVLMELRSAVLALRQDLALSPSSYSFPGTSPLQLDASWQNENFGGYAVILQTSVQDLDTDKLKNALFIKKYIQPIHFDSGTSKFRNYDFYICPTTASTAACCGNNKNVVACMQDTNRCSRATKGFYYGARILTDGTIEQFSDTNCINSQEEEEEQIQTGI